MIPTTETSFGFGLRDPASGHFVRVDTSHDSMSGHAKLSLVDYGVDTPILSFDCLNDLLAASREDTPWYNSSARRPKWGDVDVPSMIPVRFTRIVHFDGFGGEPVSTSTSAEVVVSPRQFAGKSYPTRRDAPDIVLNRVFSAGWRADFESGDKPEMFIVDLADGEIEGDMIVFNEYGEARQIVSAIEVPADWPSDRHESFDINSPTLRLVLTRFGIEAPVRPFEAGDFDVDPAPQLR